jgi:hypothetical protein
MFRCPITALALMACLGLCSETTAQTVRVEGEKPSRSTMTRHPYWYDQVKKEDLSGGDWVSNWADTEGTAEYDINVPKAGRYAFWVRANPVATLLDYALGKGPWVPIKLDDGVVDTVNVAADGKIDLRYVAWKKVGDLDLPAGRQTIRFRMHSGNNNHGGLDVFVLTTEPFSPSGKGLSGQSAAPQVPKGTWAFQPERDTFDASAAFDLRKLNEPVAGASGFVKLSRDGEGFVLGDGAPVRFWAVTTYVQRDRSTEDLAHHARFLAKRGVNMVRYHGALEPKDKNAKFTDADQKGIDEAWKLVAAMKKEGIYTTLSPYWSANLKQVPASWGLEGWPENASPMGLLYFDEVLQTAYKSWLKALLTPPNPYTGVPLAKDPALAIFQLQNEDSLLFWTEQNIKGKARERLGQKFGAWLVKKYGSLDAAKKAWGGEATPEDDFSRGVVGLYIIWQMTQDRTGGLQARLADQLHFYADTMASFNVEIARYLREDLGCKMLVNAGNWKTASAVRLDDVERWSYTANEVLAVNRYYSLVHLGPEVGWRIGAGDHFQDESVLKHPRDLPVSLKQVVGHPMMVTESHWVPPLSYQSEGPFLVAAYSSLSGLGPFYWFATAETEWANQDRAPWDAASRAKWTVATPMVLGQFPAASLMYRKGYVKTGPPVVEEHRAVEDLWQRVPPLIAEDPGYDPNRDLGDAPKRSNLKGGVDPLAFLVGPVKVAFDGKKSATKLADLSTSIQGKTVRSNTGQLQWDTEKGVCTLDAPCAQGATGFLSKAGSIKLDALTIESSDHYATVLAVSLDEKPLTESSKVLVQVGTRARPIGWVEHAEAFPGADGKTTYQGKKVDDTGKMPWLIAEAKLKLAVKNAKLKTATTLDLNGKPRGDAKATQEKGALSFTFPGDAMYVVLRGE